MRVRFSFIALAACAASILAGTPMKAPAADMVVVTEERGFGECANTGVLARISERFRYQVRHVPNLPDVEISDFRRIHEHRYEPKTEDSPIARRYCGATALLSDGHQRDVWYLIEYGMGLAGIGNNVEFCVSGFDRWKVYDGRCRVLW
jgi:capsid protein